MNLWLKFLRSKKIADFLGKVKTQEVAANIPFAFALLPYAKQLELLEYSINAANSDDEATFKKGSIYFCQDFFYFNGIAPTNLSQLAPFSPCSSQSSSKSWCNG
jgi:hypothetical protein